MRTGTADSQFRIFVAISIPCMFIAAYALRYFPWLLAQPMCGFKALIGIDCPGCGLTRSMVALVHGSIRGSIEAHPMGPVIAIALTALWIAALYGFVSGREMSNPFGRKASYVIAAAVVAAFIGHWLARLMI